jgi:hypothetical protein
MNLRNEGHQFLGFAKDSVMARIAAVLADLGAGWIAQRYRGDPPKSRISGEPACMLEIIVNRDPGVPSADSIWIVPIEPHSFAACTLRPKIVQRWCFAANKPEQLAYHATLHLGGADSSACSDWFIAGMALP